jgi:uncharacterized protein YbaP (TraB family)
MKTISLLDKLVEKVLYVRNQGMTETILKALAKPDTGSCFFAAGVGHYVGEKSVKELLQSAGYTVTRVPSEP